MIACIWCLQGFAASSIWGATTRTDSLDSGLCPNQIVDYDSFHDGPLTQTHTCRKQLDCLRATHNLIRDLMCARTLIGEPSDRILRIYMRLTASILLNLCITFGQLSCESVCCHNIHSLLPQHISSSWPLPFDSFLDSYGFQDVTSCHTKMCLSCLLVANTSDTATKIRGDLLSVTIYTILQKKVDSSGCKGTQEWFLMNGTQVHQGRLWAEWASQFIKESPTADGIMKTRWSWCCQMWMYLHMRCSCNRKRAQPERARFKAWIC